MGWACPECGIDNDMSKMVCECGYKASIESDLREITIEKKVKTVKWEYKTVEMVTPQGLFGNPHKQLKPSVIDE